ncbi:MAG: hypothetical protein L0211_24445 [Planctomycetaceae bacterium]|nr:hypothetical protein [Planctomycetaceae bacterium]
METTLHRQLKALYAGSDARVEQRVAGFRYRIDAVRGEELVEIQHGSLAAIRDKIAKLLANHRVLVVKPIVVRKMLVSLSRKGGRELVRKASPKRGTLLDVFDELVYFTRVFPHPNLTLETPLVEIEERRYPGHGKRRRWRRKDFVVEDQRLAAVIGVERFRAHADLWRLVPAGLAEPFHTGELAESLGVRRWIAQRIAYCLRKTGAADIAGKKGNAWLYRRAG